MSDLFNKILYQPLLDVLTFLYGYFGDLGLAIIGLTILIRIILFPLFYKGAKDQAIIQKIAPKIKEIQTRHKNNREEQARALMEIYREHRVNPLSGFLLIILQIPILIALYQVFVKINDLTLNPNFLGLVNLGQANMVIVGLAALAQYFQGKLSFIKNGKSFQELTPMERMGRQMIYLGPVLTIVFLYFLPSAVGLYWLTTSLFSVIQQIIINKKVHGPASS
jgi:YidC/Oxa1 family membrane protein insertase